MKFEDMINKRNVHSNKGDYGRVLCVCGSYGMAGAAILCGKASLRCGIGLLDLAVEESIYPVVANNVHEAIYTIYSNESNLLDSIIKADVIAIGCGLSQRAVGVVKYVLNNSDKPLVIDADALNIIAAEKINLKTIKTTKIITPHLKEMARLIDKSVAYVKENSIEVAKEYALKHQTIVVLKSHQTLVVSDKGDVYLNDTGNPGMATGGSGDVLAGMISAFIANNDDVFKATCAAVYFHGLAGDLASRRLSMTSMLPSDIIDELPSLFNKIEKKRVSNENE